MVSPRVLSRRALAHQYPSPLGVPPPCTTAAATLEAGQPKQVFISAAGGALTALGCSCACSYVGTHSHHCVPTEVHQVSGARTSSCQRVGSLCPHRPVRSSSVHPAAAKLSPARRLVATPASFIAAGSRSTGVSGLDSCRSARATPRPGRRQTPAGPNARQPWPSPRAGAPRHAPPQTPASRCPRI